MAVAEELIASEAFTLFVTHYSELTKLDSMYPNVRNIHIMGSICIDNDIASETQYNHKLNNGPCRLQSGYGIKMAENCGFPDSIINDAHYFASKLQYLNPVICDSGMNNNMLVLRSLLDNLLILESSTLSTDGLRNYLNNLYCKFSATQRDTLRKLIDSLYLDSMSRQKGENSVCETSPAVATNCHMQLNISPSTRSPSQKKRKIAEKTVENRNNTDALKKENQPNKLNLTNVFVTSTTTIQSGTTLNDADTTAKFENCQIITDIDNISPSEFF